MLHNSNYLFESDKALIAELYQGVNARPGVFVDQLPYRNEEIAGWVESNCSVKALYERLEERGTFELNTETVLWTDRDGEEKTLLMNRASSTHMWPMGTNYWVRDNAIIGARLLQTSSRVSWYSEELRDRGRELLLSSLTVMSSCQQLERFEAIVEGRVDEKDPHVWPHIFLDIESNMNAAKDEPWMHQQDAWQIACYYVLEAVEYGRIDHEALTEKHLRLLRLVVPFLKAVDFSRCENGGSWEEIAAVRTSVLSWEVSLLAKIKAAKWLEVDEDLLDSLMSQGVEHLQKAIPYESPTYDHGDARYREADSSLIYLLMLDVFPLVDAERQNALRDRTIDAVESLVSDYGAKRYLGDSYQGFSYYTKTVSHQLSELYDSPSGDSSGVSEFIQRGKLVPQGHEAQWTHFIWQLSTAFGELYLREKNQTYLEKQQKYFKMGLSLVTGSGEKSLQQVDGEMEVFDLPSFRMPECYNSELYQGEIFLYPSLHTPLYWSVAESLAAFAQMELSSLGETGSEGLGAY